MTHSACGMHEGVDKRHDANERIGFLGADMGATEKQAASTFRAPKAPWREKWGATFSRRSWMKRDGL